LTNHPRDASSAAGLLESPQSPQSSLRIRPGQSVYGIGVGLVNQVAAVPAKWPR